MNPTPLLIASKPYLGSNSGVNPLRGILSGGLLYRLLSGAGVKTLTARAYEKQLVKFDALDTHTWDDMCALFHMTPEQASALIASQPTYVAEIRDALSPERQLEWKQHKSEIHSLYKRGTSAERVRAYTAKFHTRVFGCLNAVSKKCKAAVSSLSHNARLLHPDKSIALAIDLYLAAKDHAAKIAKAVVTKAKAAIKPIEQPCHVPEYLETAIQRTTPLRPPRDSYAVEILTC